MKAMDPLTAIAERRIQEAIDRGEFDDLPGKRTMNKLEFTRQAFPNNGMNPSEYTCDGANENPPLTTRNVPVTSRSTFLYFLPPMGS